MNELTYWLTLTFLQDITIRRKNELYVNCWNHNPRVSIEQLFEDSSIWKEIGMTQEECEIFAASRSQLAQHSFLAEDMLSQGYDIIPLISRDYSQTLKDNLKMICPPILFSKGDKALLQTPSVAIVGSRNAIGISLEFTSTIAQKVVSEGKVVVSGFAKGVDRMALDAALEAGGKSIIVLPQGIATFSSGFKQYYKYIHQGRLLVVSPFFPTAPWSAEFAMRRNPYIYGLAKEIYVAQSDDKGGTWSGVIDGLRKKRSIYVRYPATGEQNANLLLIQKGALAVDKYGNRIQLSPDELLTPEEKERKNMEEKIKSLLSKGDMTSKDILREMTLDWSDSKIKAYLRKLPFVEEYKQHNKLYYKTRNKVDQLALVL